MSETLQPEQDDSNRLRLLLVEDSVSDAELITFWLERAGFSVHSSRVETEKEMRHALSARKFDIILSDYILPAFSGSAALRVTKELSPDTPLIIVSNNIGKETAVTLMLEGARDYIMKNNISRLIPAIEREVAEAEVRYENRKIHALVNDITSKLLHLAGERFVDELVKVLADTLEADYAYVAVFDEAASTADVLAMYADGVYLNRISYSLKGAPCQHVLQERYYREDGQLVERYPDAELLRNRHVASYVAHAMHNNKGVVTGVVAIMHESSLPGGEYVADILRLCALRASAELERMRGEKKLMRSEARMRSILNNTRDVLFQMDINGLMQWVTPSVMRLLGYTPDELLGKPYDSVFIADPGLLTLRETLDENSGEIDNLELPLLHKGGHSVWVSINAQYSYADDGRTITGIEGAARDITQRRLAESARRQSEELFSKAFHSSPAMISISYINDDYSAAYFMDINEAFLKAVGYTRNEVIGKSALDLCLFVGDGQREALMSQLRTKGHTGEVEIPFRTSQGETRYALGSVELIDIGGKPCVLVVCQDITERKTANEDLVKHREQLEELVAQRTQELSAAIRDLETEIADRKRIEKSLVDAMEYAQTASKAKSEFLANMSHELRTPLNSIIGFAELLMLETGDQENSDARERITHILDSAWMLLSLINDILDLSKIEAGKLILECESVSLQNLLDSGLVMLKEKAHKRQVELTCSNQVKDDTVFVDPRKVKQILFNLLDNAIKFTPPQGRVTLRAEPIGIDEYQRHCLLPGLPDARFGYFIRLDVEDSGIGIAPDDMSTLFQPFTQIDSALNRKYEGSGLGLHLSQQLARLHDGCIVAASEVGEGSTFSVVLPCGAPD